MLKTEEDLKLRTVCEFLFFDNLKNEASFQRFEQCFQPLFNNSDLSMLSVFTQIAGEKRKYITFPRLVNAYKNRGHSRELNIFFDKLLNCILQPENSFVGKEREKCYNYSTSITCGKRQFITLVQVLSDKDGGIHGFNIQYDGVFKCKMFPTKLEDSLLVTLEMTLGLIDETPITNKQIGKFLGLKEKNYRDGITHVFGTLDPQTELVTFLGFKCISGKMSFVGKPKGNGFLFGKFGTKLHDIKIQMTIDGITKFEPTFETNVRKNFFLGSFGSLLNLKDDGPIKEEKTLSTLNDAIKLNQLITTNIIDDNHFFNTKLKDKIKGNDYKEVVNQEGRSWILNEPLSQNIRSQSAPHLRTLDDCLKQFDEEYNIRSTINLRVRGELFRIGTNRTNKGKGGKSEGKNDQVYKKLLHSTKDFVANNAKNYIKDTKDGKKNAGFYIFNKKNYLRLKEHLGQKIYDECLKDSGEADQEMKKTLLSTLIAQPGSTKRFNDNLNVRSTLLRNNNDKLMPNLKTKLKGKEKVYNKREIKERKDKSDNRLRSGGNKNKLRAKGDNPTNLYSDGLQFFNDIWGFDDDDDDDYFDYNKNKTNYNDPFSNYGYGQYNYGGNYGYGGGYGYGGYGYNDYGYNYGYNDNNYPKKKEEKYVYDPVKYKAAQEKWKEFSEGMRSINGVYLLQTIGSVIKALKAIEEDDKGKNRISLIERIKLYKILEENEAIINFLTQERPKGEDEDEEAEEDILLPDEHPEDFTSLEELEQKIQAIKNHLDKKNIKPEDRRKLEKLYNLYLQQKNILIENETKKKKEELIKDDKMNYNKYIQEEQEKRRKAEEEERRKIEELQRAEERKKKS